MSAVEAAEQQSRCAIRAAKTEWHRNRSVATSRGAWLPALICMGGFARHQGKGMRVQLLDVEERQREGEEEHWNSAGLTLRTQSIHTAVCPTRLRYQTAG